MPASPLMASYVTDQAKKYIELNNGTAALDVLRPLLTTDSSYTVLLLTAQSYAILNQPQQALFYYESASKIAQNASEQRIANFGMAKMQLWLGNYAGAKTIYERMLNEPMSSEDQHLATEGLNKAKSALGESRFVATTQFKQEDKAQTATTVITPEQSSSTQFNQTVRAAQNAAIANHPKLSLAYYEQAYRLAKNEPEQQVALFGRAKMQLWLENYTAAAQFYRQLLSMSLSSGDRQLAENGLQKSVKAYQDQRIDLVRKLLIAEKYREALSALKPLLKGKSNFVLMIMAARAYAGVENASIALHYYQRAARLATKSADRRAAQFGIAKMQFATGAYQASQQSYRLLLKQKLTSEDRAIALKGLRESIYRERIAHAKTLIAKERGQESLTLLRTLLTCHPGYEVLLLTGQSYVLINDPFRALLYFQAALSVANNSAEYRLALFGVARMQFWLSFYVRAGESFKRLLQEDLPPAQFELALAGYVRSLAYYNRPRKAFLSIPPDLEFTKPEMVVAAAQASLWSNWADITECIIHTYEPLTRSLDPKSGLSRDLRDAKWQADLATSPHVISPTYFYSTDSDVFSKKRAAIDYVRYWSQMFQTTLGIDHITYMQPGFNKIIARGAYLGQIFRPTRDTIFNARIQPYSYHLWSPLLYRVSADYNPNDYVGFNLLAQREVVETFPAMDSHITDGQYSFSINLNPIPYLNINTSIYRLNFSDTNFRNGYYFSPTVTLCSELGLSAVGVIRGFKNKFKSPNYFSPHHYHTHVLILRLGRKLGATWHYYLDGGLGRQYITPLVGDPTASGPTHQWGIGLTGPVNKYLIFSLYYADVFQASSFINSPGYHYQYGAATLNILL